MKVYKGKEDGLSLSRAAGAVVERLKLRADKSIRILIELSE
jgi:hypothetical protein